MPSYSSYTHSVATENGLFRTFSVMEHTSDVTMVNGIATGVSQQWRTVQDAVTGEIVREFRPPPNVYGVPTYDFDAGQAWLEERYGKKRHGFASVGHIPECGEVVDGWTAVEKRFDGFGNTAPTITWRKSDTMAARTLWKETQGDYVRKTWTEDDNIMASNGFTIGTTWGAGYVSNHNHIAVNVDYDALLKDANPKKAPTNPDAVHPEATYFEECRYGGYCYMCEEDIEPGDSIWWWRPAKGKSRIWCGDHKTTAVTAAGTNKNEDNDMAQRQDFTFPYSGAEISASLERKAAKLDAQIQSAVQIDRATAALLGYETDRDYENLLKQKQEIVDKANKKLEVEARSLRKEAIPYAKASKQTFEIDLEDIEFFGLNDDEELQAPKPRRTRRSKEQIAADAEASAA